MVMPAVCYGPDALTADAEARVRMMKLHHLDTGPKETLSLPMTGLLAQD